MLSFVAQYLRKRRQTYRFRSEDASFKKTGIGPHLLCSHNPSLHRHTSALRGNTNIQLIIHTHFHDRLFFHTNMSLSIKPFNMYRHVDVFDHKTWARTGLLVVPFYPKYAVTCIGPAPATIIRWGMCRWWLVKTTVAFNIRIYQYQIHLVCIFRISTPCSML